MVFIAYKTHFYSVVPVLWLKKIADLRFHFWECLKLKEFHFGVFGFSTSENLKETLAFVRTGVFVKTLVVGEFENLPLSPSLHSLGSNWAKG